MSKLEFLQNSIVDRLSFEWPVNTRLRQIKESADGRKEVLNTNILVLGYKLYCNPTNCCSGCSSKGRVLHGRTWDNATTEFCIGKSEGYKQSVTYWEEDK